MLVIYAGLLALTVQQRSTSTPTGLVPQLDRGYFIAAIQLPAGSSLRAHRRGDPARRPTSSLTRPGVAHAVAFVGLDGATFTNAPNTGVVFVTLKPFEDRSSRASPRT